MMMVYVDIMKKLVMLFRKNRIIKGIFSFVLCLSLTLGLILSGYGVSSVLAEEDSHIVYLFANQLYYYNAGDYCSDFDIVADCSSSYSYDYSSMNNPFSSCIVNANVDLSVSFYQWNNQVKKVSLDTVKLTLYALTDKGLIPIKSMDLFISDLLSNSGYTRNFTFGNVSFSTYGIIQGFSVRAEYIGLSVINSYQYKYETYMRINTSFRPTVSYFSVVDNASSSDVQAVVDKMDELLSDDSPDYEADTQLSDTIASNKDYITDMDSQEDAIFTGASDSFTNVFENWDTSTLASGFTFFNDIVNDFYDNLPIKYRVLLYSILAIGMIALFSGASYKIIRKVKDGS